MAFHPIHRAFLASAKPMPNPLTEGDGTGLTSACPRIIGRRHLNARTRARVDASRSVGGFSVRYAEGHWLSFDARCDDEATTVGLTAQLSDITQTVTAQLPSGAVDLVMEMAPPIARSSQMASGGDSIRLTASASGQCVGLAKLDGRFWTAEACASFTGRVFGAYAREGSARFLSLRYCGSEGPLSTQRGSLP
jgi:xylan 1,4-beta-xylosidase